MRFVTAVKDERSFVGLVDERVSYIIDVQYAEEALLGSKNIPNSIIDFIRMNEVLDESIKVIEKLALEQKGAQYFYSPNDVKIKAPIPRPLKNIFCVGKNYAEHAIEMGSEADIPEHLMMFTKAPTTVIGPNDSVLLHENITNQLDYEGELAIVIGKKGRSISKEEALDYVFGYTIVNDITARDLQSRHKQFFIGKSLDASCPMGPFIAHKSIISNPNHLSLETKVNGELRQKGNTKQFIFDVQTIISVISAGMTLEPGDIIATGTPAGVGKGFKPPRFLKQGDSIEISIEGLGTLINSVGV
ncbi:fumarylacetoacetate hydrolase family protein [Litchfieldia salsa]|uniref:2-keto-4-pentenoate hydratase/2-oxohepta-3-ene-1,7-dioic acid hydratase (Catechol pathway) n=1 Tax=Litchfieldia salsa TaxID=930152 RepID=A0A1H0UMC9_9BACI|nr:fumarylacetoacetate hydrolase family protein [Litchfieldia salsa]SDP67324.1 2-keto-4-pentenoate hydratase/2-oxohepta-3-ene-1,7-dioic acid hydratase (catechol pathway) [Litchfieldia salsa]